MPNCHPLCVLFVLTIPTNRRENTNDILANVLMMPIQMAVNATHSNVAMVAITVANAKADDDDNALAFLLATTIERHAIGIIMVAKGTTTAQKSMPRSSTPCSPSRRGGRKAASLTSRGTSRGRSTTIRERRNLGRRLKLGIFSRPVGSGFCWHATKRAAAFLARALAQFFLEDIKNEKSAILRRARASVRQYSPAERERITIKPNYMISLPRPRGVKCMGDGSAKGAGSQFNPPCNIEGGI